MIYISIFVILMCLLLCIYIEMHNEFFLFPLRIVDDTKEANATFATLKNVLVEYIEWNLDNCPRQMCDRWHTDGERVKSIEISRIE